MFIDPTGNDFRTKPYSPVINSGDPADLPPPGSAGRVDIGHIEQYGASFFVDDDYCQTCANDGLIWQVDAFTSIQEAIAAAEAVQQTLTTEAAVQFKIGIAPGTYTESITINSPIWLQGSGAEVTSLASAGTAVTFANATHAGIRDFTIIGTNNNTTGIHITNASNNITVTRNLIKDHGSLGTGVLVNGRSSGHIAFNTLANIGHSIEVEGDWAWADVENNIITTWWFDALEADSGSIINSNFNLLNNPLGYGSYYDGIVPGLYDITGSDPLFVDNNTYHIQEGSPAMDTAYPLADVPVGGGVAADRGYFEVTDATIAATVFLGKLDQSRTMANVGVQSVEYSVVPVADVTSPVTATLPGSWQTAVLATPNQSLTYWNSNYTPTAEGYYRLYSRATDVNNNTETNHATWYDGAFIVDETPPIVTWTLPLNGATSNTGFLVLQAETADYALNLFNVDTIAFDIDGTTYPATWSSDPWTADGHSPRSFILYTNMISTGLSIGSHSAKAIVTDKAGNRSQSQTINFTVTAVGTPDTIAPTLTITSHLSGDVVHQTETVIAGSGGDADSGLQGYYISFNAGVSWQEMSNTGSGFRYRWVLGTQQGTTYPLKVRAIDWAGNHTSQDLVLSIDTVPPSDINPITIEHAPGSHSDMMYSTPASWITPTDNSGAVTVYADTREDPIQEDDYMYTNYSLHETNFGFAGFFEGFLRPLTYYAAIRVEDLGGHRQFYSFGPWYVGTVRDSSVIWQEREQSIRATLDGHIDIEHLEWLTPTEHLDDDPRPINGRQAFYAAWDGSGPIVAWEGASWNSQGDLWVYYDLYNGGTTQPITITGSLPFEADLAIHIKDEQHGYVWQYSSGQWQQQTMNDKEYNFSHNPERGWHRNRRGARV